MSRATRIWLALWGAGILASAILAADADQILYPGKTAPTAAPATGAVGNLTLVCGLALAAVGGWLVWRGRQRGLRASDSRTLAISETRALGNRQYLVVACFENKKFLLGVCPERIAMLAPLHDEGPGK
jgi:flagellar protein FliO/FliZ